MMTITEMEEILEELSAEFPKVFYKELNGGIILLPELKRNTAHNAEGLYILGEYHRSGNMGRYIVIYYGSFMHIYPHLQREDMKNRLRDTLKHEFTHHLESLAGERKLEVEDAKFIANYKKKHGYE